METNTLVARINENLDKHFKSNKGNWWASQGFYDNDDKVTIRIRDMWGRTKVSPKFVALYILRTEPTIKFVTYDAGWDTWVYTRETLRWGGHNV